MTGGAGVRRSPSVLLGVLYALVAVDLAATVAALAYGGGWFAGGPVDAGALVLSAWVVAPIVAMGVGVGVTARRLRRGLVVVAVGVVLLTVLTLLALQDFITSESSTAALIFLTLPVIQWVLALAAVGIAAAVHGARGRPPSGDVPASTRPPE